MTDRFAKNEDHDGIMALLRLPDPVERKLALRSKQVLPYHLRAAMQDTDPEIRKLAATHPALTPELIRETLAGDDKDLKHAILTRQDLDEKHLASVATDPDFAHVVANHPKTTDAIRDMVLSSGAPHGVKALHSSQLSKSIGFITYPLLGEGSVYTKPMHLNREQGEVRSHYSSDPGMTGKGTTGWTSGTYADSGDEGLEPHLRQVNSIMYSPKRAPAIPGQEGKMVTGKKLHDTESHEAQHSVFLRIGQKHGNNAQLRVVATTLSRLQPHHRAHIHNLVAAHPASGTMDIKNQPEEAIAYLQSYLQNPRHRELIHKRLDMHSVADQQQSVQLARKAWNELRRIGNALRPEEVGIVPENASNRMAKWVKRLKKRESNPSDQLGFSVSFIEAITICEFLTGRTLDQKVLRRAVLDAGGDGLTGILKAFGLSDEKGRKAFDSIKSLKLHKSEDALKNPKQITGIDNDSIAQDLIEAYAENKVTPVTLDGKHSSGAYMMEDADGASWLLKPGSGKKSPAAGVDETQASQSKREAVFSAVAQWMEIEEVQPAHLLNIDGREVAIIKMWPMDFVNLHKTITTDPNLPRRALEPYRRSGQIFKWAVLDFVLGNADRHGNNVMVGPQDEGNKIGLIDHGSSIAGHGFDPGNDEDSFIPYYLRVWAGPNFHTLTPKMQLAQMPSASGEVDESLREWIDALSPEELASILARYGVDPSAVVNRLAEVQSDPMVEKVSDHINRLWLQNPVTALADLNQALEGPQR